MLLQISNSEFNSKFTHPRALAHKVHNPNIKEGSIAWRADQDNTVSMLIFHISEQVLGHFPFVRTGRLDHCRTSQLANEIGFFQRVFAEKPSPWCILFTIWLIWLDSFDLKWNSQYDRDGLAGQFWQWKASLVFRVKKGTIMPWRRPEAH